MNRESVRNQVVGIFRPPISSKSHFQVFSQNYSIGDADRKRDAFTVSPCVSMHASNRERKGKSREVNPQIRSNLWCRFHKESRVFSEQ